MCQSLGGKRLEQRVLDEVFAVLEPAALIATAAALADAESLHAQRLQAFELAVERARFDADRARRQFDAIEPENRLVGRSLEAAWEAALTVLRRAETDLMAQRACRPATLSSEEADWVTRAGADVRAIFNAPTTTWRERKQLLRALSPRSLSPSGKPTAKPTANHLGGRPATEFTMALNRPGGHFRTTDEDIVELVRRLAAHYDDTTIAVILGRNQGAPPPGCQFTKSRVKSVRVANRIAPFAPVTVTPNRRQCHGGRNQQSRTAPRGIKSDPLSVAARRIHHRRTDRRRRPVAHPHRRRSPSHKSSATPPPGWVNLDQAAAALGVARQTVIDRIRRGEINAVHVNRGRRRGLAIDIGAAEPLPGTR